MFMIKRRTLGAKIESTPYTVETLNGNDYNIPAYNVNYKGDIPMKDRKLVRGNYSSDPAVPGKRKLTISFSVDLYYSGTANTAPATFKLFRGCAMKQTAHTTKGISLVTDSDYTNVPLTMEVVEKAEGASPSQVVIKGRGMMGNAKLVCDNTGEPIRIDYEFQGVLSSIADRAYGSIIAPSMGSIPVPDNVMGCGVTLFGEAQTINKFTIDLGNQVEVCSDPKYTEGYEGAHVVDRTPVLELDPDLELVATQDDISRWTGATTGAFSCMLNTRLLLSAPKAQYKEVYSPGEREGHVVNQKICGLHGDSGDDDFEILHGSKT